MPTFICNELLAQCIAENTQSSRLQDDCKKNIGDLCGTITPPTLSEEDSTTTASAAASSTASDAASATGETVATTSSQALAAPTMMPAAGHGAFALAVGVMAYML